MKKRIKTVKVLLCLPFGANITDYIKATNGNMDVIATKVKGRTQIHTVEIVEDVETVQAIIGGYFELVNFADAGVLAIVNEEGRLKDLDFTGYFGEHAFVGPVILAGADGRGNLRNVDYDAAMALINA